MSALRIVTALFGLWFVLSSGCPQAFADDSNAAGLPPIRRFEAYAGADSIGNTVGLYGGMTAALFGGICDDGWRVGSIAGFTRYRYSRPVFDVASQQTANARFRGLATFVDAMVGYQQQIGPVTMKGYLGISQISHRILPLDPNIAGADEDNLIQREKLGPKVAIETWTRLSDWGFVQADANVSAPFRTYAARVRLGYNIASFLSAGLETAAGGNRDYALARGGLFLRGAWSWGELSASVGLAASHSGNEGAYATAGALFRF